MDANAHRGPPSEGNLHVADLGAGLRGLGLESCFGDPPDAQMVQEMGLYTVVILTGHKFSNNLVSTAAANA